MKVLRWLSLSTLLPALLLGAGCGADSSRGVGPGPPREPERATATLEVLYSALPEPHLVLEEPPDHTTLFAQPGEIARFAIRVSCPEQPRGECDAESLEQFEFRLAGVEPDTARYFVFDNLIRAHSPPARALLRGLGVAGLGEPSEVPEDEEMGVERASACAPDECEESVRAARDQVAGYRAHERRAGWPFWERPETPFEEWLEGAPDAWRGAGEVIRARVWSTESERARGPLFFKFTWEVRGPEGTHAVLDPHIFIHGDPVP